MALLVGSSLGKSFGPEDIFADVSVSVPHGARVAMVGPNGAGKTTLLNILAGLESPSEGTVTRAKGTRIGYLPQRPELHGQHTVYEEAVSAFTELRAMETRLASVAEALADPSRHETALAEYGALEEAFEQAGGYSYEQRIRTVLQGVGFAPDDFHTPLRELSGGQKTRALLGRLLLESPDILALDEPTNHLDIAAVEWLEGYLKEFSGAVIVVSHDRYFLDAVATTIWELDFGSLQTYRGNYSAYVQQRQERHERLLIEYEAQQEFIARQEDYIRRNIAGQNTRQAKGRLRRLERLKRDDLILKPRTRKSLKLRLNASARSGDLVLRSRDLTVGYPDRPLFTTPNLLLRRGDVAALIGPNGAGKSTFIRTIIGELEPVAGALTVGASVTIGYFAQAHESLDPDQTILDEVMSARGMLPAEARSFLGLFLFEGDDVFRHIRSLSGGERGRVALAKLALSGANFLILDEPTNHLDIASQEALQNVLSDYDGTILLVSHDRYLIDALATQVWSLEDGALRPFDGSYSEWTAAREQERLKAAAVREQMRTAVRPVEVKRSNGKSLALVRQIEAAELRVHALEEELMSVATSLESASASGDGRQAHALGEQYARLELELNAAMEAWSALVDG